MRLHAPYRLAIVAAFVALSAAGAVYKWVDEKGVTQYGEMPPPGARAQEVAIRLPPAPDAAQGSTQEGTRRAADEEAERRASLARRQQAALMKSWCEQAQKDLYVLELELPAYTTDERGERVYLEDKDRPAAIEYTKQRIAENCVSP